MTHRLLVPLFVGALAFPAFADKSDEVTKFLNASITLYENLEYTKALAQIAKAKAKAQGPDDEARCSVLEGIVLADMGKDDKATTAFKAAFGINPDLKLPVEVAPKIATLAEKARENVKKMLAPTLAAQKAEEDKRLADEKAKSDALKAEEDKKRREDAEQQAKDDAERKRLLQPPPAVVKAGPSLRSFSWIPGAVGLVGAGLATYFFVRAGSLFSQLDARNLQSGETPQSARDGGKTTQTLAAVLTGVAVAGIGTAVVLFLIGAEPAATPHVSVFFGPTGASAVVSTSFDLTTVLR